VGRRLPKAIPREVWDSIIDAAAQGRGQEILAPRDQAIIAVFLFSGVRCFELVALDLPDLDWERGRIHVRHGKGDKERWAALGGLAFDFLEAYLDVRPDCVVIEGAPPERHQPVFVSRKRGRLSTSGVRRLTARIEALLEGKGIHPHAFRHSHITEVVRVAEEKGKSIFEVAEQAGHRKLDTTRGYYAANAAKRKELVDGI
jgi:integrase